MDVAGNKGEDEAVGRPEDEVVQLAAELIRFDTTNPGTHGGPGPERAAAEYVAERLAEAG